MLLLSRPLNAGVVWQLSPVLLCVKAAAQSGRYTLHGLEEYLLGLADFKFGFFSLVRVVGLACYSSR
jgi:hypothetical protein